MKDNDINYMNLPTNEEVIKFLKWAGPIPATAYNFDRPEGHAEARKNAGWGK